MGDFGAALSDSESANARVGGTSRRYLAFREDSPAFRKELDMCEENARNVRTWLKATVKAVRTYSQAGARFSEAERSYANEILAFGGGPNQAPVMSAGVGPALWTISTALKEVANLNYSSMLHVEKEYANRIDAGAEEDVKALRDLKHRFVKADDKYRAALDRARSMKKDDNEGKLHGADRELTSAKLALENARFDLVAKLNELESGRQVDLLECMCECVRVQHRHARQAQEHLARMASNLPAWRDLIRQKRAHLAQLSAHNEVAQRHLHTNSQEHAPGLVSSPLAAPADPGGPSVVKEGYLFKKSAHSAGWRRVWVEVRDGSLIYSSQRPESRRRGINLLLCTIQHQDSSESGRRFCFEVVTPERTLTLQAESDADLAAWVEALRGAIQLAFHSLDTDKGVASNSAKLDAGVGGEAGDVATAPLAELRAAHPANNVCADCGAEAPDWAVLNWGVVVCIECSGVHRSLGVHVSKVRSLTLDTWERSLLGLMKALGNEHANRVLEEGALGAKPTPGSTRPEREDWIRSKYEDRDFVQLPWAYGALPQMLCDAVRADDAQRAMLCIAQGADMHAAVVPAVDHHLHATEADVSGVGDGAQAGGGVGRGDGASHEPQALNALQHAAACNAGTCIELLCHWGAPLGVAGASGASPLHLACASGHARAVSLLLKRGAQPNLVDEAGQTAEAVARAAGHVDAADLIVAWAESAPHRAGGSAASKRDSFSAGARQRDPGGDGAQGCAAGGVLSERSFSPTSSMSERTRRVRHSIGHSRGASLGARVSMFSVFRRGQSVTEVLDAERERNLRGGDAEVTRDGGGGGGLGAAAARLQDGARAPGPGPSSGTATPVHGRGKAPSATGRGVVEVEPTLMADLAEPPAVRSTSMSVPSRSPPVNDTPGQGATADDGGSSGAGDARGASGRAVPPRHVSPPVMGRTPPGPSPLAPRPRALSDAGASPPRKALSDSSASNTSSPLALRDTSVHAGGTASPPLARDASPSDFSPTRGGDAVAMSFEPSAPGPGAPRRTSSASGIGAHGNGEAGSAAQSSSSTPAVSRKASATALPRGVGAGPEGHVAGAASRRESALSARDTPVGGSTAASGRRGSAKASVLPPGLPPGSLSSSRSSSLCTSRQDSFSSMPSSAFCSRATSASASRKPSDAGQVPAAIHISMDPPSQGDSRSASRRVSNPSNVAPPGTFNLRLDRPSSASAAAGSSHKSSGSSKSGGSSALHLGMDRVPIPGSRPASSVGASSAQSSVQSSAASRKSSNASAAEATEAATALRGRGNNAND